MFNLGCPVSIFLSHGTVWYDITRMYVGHIKHIRDLRVPNACFKQYCRPTKWERLL